MGGWSLRQGEREKEEVREGSKGVREGGEDKKARCLEKEYLFFSSDFLYLTILSDSRFSFLVDSNKMSSSLCFPFLFICLPVKVFRSFSFFSVLKSS